MSFTIIGYPRKKTSLGESLAKSHAYNPIRDSRIILATAKSLAKSLVKSVTESLRESRIGLYAWLLARLSEICFYTRVRDGEFLPR